MSVEKILTVQQACELVGVSRTTLWRMEREGKFPGRVQVSARRVGFRERAIDEWRETLRPANSPAPADNGAKKRAKK